MAFVHWKPPQFRFTSPSIHLRRVGYYKTVAERSEAQGDGIYTLETIENQVHQAYICALLEFQGVILALNQSIIDFNSVASALSSIRTQLTGLELDKLNVELN